MELNGLAGTHCFCSSACEDVAKTFPSGKHNEYRDAFNAQTS